MLLVGVDIGTQATKCAVYNERGERLVESSEQSVLSRPAPGIVEEEPERQLASVCRTINRSMESSAVNPGEVAAVAIDGQMAGVIGVGKDGTALTPYDSWLDTRCSPQIDEMKRIAGRDVITNTGCAPSFNHGPKILWWKQNHPELFREIRSFVQPAGYAAMRICDLQADAAFLDWTYLHFSGFANNPTATWDQTLCESFDVPLTKLPRIVAPQEIIGAVSPSMAAACGLRSGTPIVAGCGDTAASFLSCGATRPGICVDVAGTASVFAATTTEFAADVDRQILGCGRAATEGLWHPYAYINGGGMNLEWIRAIADKLGGRRVPLAELDLLAAEVVDPSLQPFFVPHFGGRVAPAMPELRGAWVGLDWNHGAGELYRAILESVAFEYGVYLDALGRLYPGLAPNQIRVTGGGEKSRIWNQIKAAVLKTPVHLIAGGGGAPMGSAMLAGYGVGLFSGLEEISHSWVRTGPGATPADDLVAGYAGRIERYMQLINTLNTYHRGA